MNHLARWPIDRETGRDARPAATHSGLGRVNTALPVDPREVVRGVAAQRGETLAKLFQMLIRDED